MSSNGARFVLPYQTVIDGAGVPIPGAFLFFYVSETDTPLDTYANPTLTVPNTNPVQADAAGRFGNIFMLGTYKVVLTDADLNQIWTADPVMAPGSGEIVSIIRLIPEAATVTILDSDTEVGIDTRVHAVTANLPSSVAWASANQTGLELTLFDYYGNAAANNITPVLNGTDVFIGGLTPLVLSNFGLLKLRPTSTGWYIRST